MPRIDETRPGTESVLVELDVTWSPGEPVDVCWQCWWDHLEPVGEEAGVAHPPYEEGGYTCAICEEPLEGDDNYA